jgi:hypothetical protein
MKKEIYLIVMLFVLLSLTACGGQAGTPAVSPLTIEQLKNAEYQSEFPASGKAKLTDGAYEEEIVPGSATKLVIKLSDQYAIGDLNGDGVDDAAVVLVADPGGSGTFYTLEAVINQNGAPNHVATEFLGDRVKLNSISIESGEILVDMITHGPNDPMCCPTLEATQKYKLQGDTLVQL